MRRALVTGCAGFIGSHLTDALLDQGWAVYGVDNLSNGSIENMPANGNFEFIECNLQELDLSTLPRQVDTVFHLAAVGSVPRSIETPQVSHDNNVNTFVNVLDFARSAPNKPRVVFASSSSVYGSVTNPYKTEHHIGKPLSPYAATKQINEMYAEVFAKSYRIDAIGLRYFNVFGPRQKPNGPYSAVIPKWAKAMIDGRPVQVYGSPDKRRDFTPVSDVVKATIMAADHPMKGWGFDVFNVGCGTSISLKDLFILLKDITGSDSSLETAEARPGDIDSSTADTTKSEHILRFKPTMNMAVMRRHLQSVVSYIKTHEGSLERHLQ